LYSYQEWINFVRSKIKYVALLSIVIAVQLIVSKYSLLVN